MPLNGVGFGEWMVIAMLVLIVFGPRRLPEISRTIGKAMREFKRGMNEIQRELEVADRQDRWASKGSGAAGTATAAATAAKVAPADGAEGASGSGSTGGSAEAADQADSSNRGEVAAPEPVIAPPTFGSDLPEEIEAQLAPLPTETAVRTPPPAMPAPEPPELSPEPDTDPIGSDAPGEESDTGSSEGVESGAGVGGEEADTPAQD